MANRQATLERANVKDLTGAEFPCGTVIRFAGASEHQKSLWEFLCKHCGNLSVVPRGSLNLIKSCGCLRAGNKRVDYTGQRKGRGTVITSIGTTLVGKRGLRQTLWLLKCDCGNEYTTTTGALTSENTSSCGCLKADLDRVRMTTHGMSYEPEYYIWRNMIDRCTNPNSQCWKDYGGRGIQVCDRWMGDNGFLNFYADVGPRPSKAYSIDRYPNNNGNYEPGNVRWATYRQQNRNTRTNRLLTFQGETLTISEWASRFDLHPSTIANRIKSGFSIEESITTPAGFIR